MKTSENKMWEAWGEKANVLYTDWCTRQGKNPYRLFVLYAHAPVTQKEIAERTGLSKQTVSTVMRALKSEGMVSFSTGEADRREKKVSLTESGSGMQKKNWLL